jgi:hypothetical protein
MATIPGRTRLATVWLCCAACAICASSAWGGDFDGSKPLLCATIDAHSCDPGQTCLRGLPADLGVPQFLRIDFSKKTVVGPARTTPIRFMEAGTGQLLLQGTELGFAWSIALDTADGTMTLSLVNRDDAYMLFGACTPNMP